MMFSPDRFRRIDAVFDAALELPENERTAWVERACNADEAMRAEVMSLLETARTAESVIGENVAEFAAPFVSQLAEDQDDPPLAVGALLGPWRVEAAMGRGGMGAVYRAERADGAFQRRVAIKVVRRGMDTADVLHRFRKERRILAALDHPNIARLLDGGATPDGRPFIVMEHVEGERIDRWCVEQALDQRARARLVRDVCLAVDQAHRRLIVHRDIKPSNVLVTTDGVPKLLDFGIAKLLEPDEDVDITVTGVRLLTPEYAAPEQLSGQPVTTATDVYALGRLLQTLLLAAGPVRGDIGVIVQRALSPEPARRYGSALQLADDLDRWLRGMPVAARPDSLAYRASKFVRRHRAAVAAAAAAVVVLIVFAVSMAAAQQRTARALSRAENERDTAEEVARLLEGILAAGDPTSASPERLDTLRVAALLDRSTERVRADLQDRPHVQARLLRTLGDAYRGLGLYAAAGVTLGEALTVQRAVGDSLALATVLNSLGRFELARGRGADAEPHLREALALHRAILDSTHADVVANVSNLAAAMQDQGDFGGAADLYDEALRALDQTTVPDTALLTTVLNGRAMLAQRAGDFDMAAALASRILAVDRARLGPTHPRVAVDIHNLAFARMRSGQLQEADSLFGEALALLRSSLGEDHPMAIDALAALANVRAQRGLRTDARPLFEAALAADLRVRGADTPARAMMLSQYADLLEADGSPAEAEAAVVQAVAIAGRTVGTRHPSWGVTTAQLARLHCARGAVDSAERLYREALLVLEAALPPAHPRIAQVRAAYARCTGRPEGDVVGR